MKISHISKAVEQAEEFIKARADAKIKSLKTRSPKLNSALLEGLDWNKIVTISGMSGSGKSTFLEQLKDDFVRLNPESKFKILSFEFEMLAQDQVARRISANTQKTIKELYSSDNPLSEEERQKAFDSVSYLKEKPIYYIEEIGTVADIKLAIANFITEHRLQEEKTDLIVTLDHVLLTGGADGQTEKVIVDTLMKETVKIKKFIHEKLGINVIFIYLAQLNRDIESMERTSKPAYHYPDKSDLFAASSTYYCSDYVMVLHKPADVRGITLGYGPPRGDYKKGLPLWHPQTGEPMIYLHIIKERFGSKAIIPFVDKMRWACIEETNL